MGSGPEGGLEVAVEHEQGAFSLSAAFAAPPGVTALFGRSGSGKTTLVNAVAGLIRPRRGRVAVAGTVLLDTEAGIVAPPHRRRIGYVFQEGRLFPHLTVRQNLLFGSAFAGGPQGGPTLETAVDLLGIGHLLRRRPASLSGGEKQRVAIGRALLARPRLLLMDEPLAALDDDRKAEILPFIERLRDASGPPILYVSHSVAEVARLADTVVVLDGGRVTTVGPAASVFADLATARVLRGREPGAVLDGTVSSVDARFGLLDLDSPAGPLTVPAAAPLPVGSGLRVRIGARDVMLATARPSGISALNVLPGTVEEVEGGQGSRPALIRVRCREVTILAEVTGRSVSALDLRPGREVFAIVKSVSLLDGPPGRPG